MIANFIIDGTRWMIRGEIGMLYLNYRPPKTIESVTSHASEFIEPLSMMVRTDPRHAEAYGALLDGIVGKTRTNGVTGNNYFWRSEFSSHLRDDYGIFTRVNSSRTVGSYGVSVHSLDRAETKGQKSYYYFDDEMVALGAGIRSGSGAAVHTTVNQAAAKQNASVDGNPVPAGTDPELVDDPSWAYNDEVGYVFPSDQRVLVSNKTQTGSWLESDPVSRDAFTLHFDHGIEPRNARYEYVVLPAKQAETVEAYAADPAVEVLRNDTEVQAVRHAGLDRTMATFYQAARLDLGDGRTLAVDQPCIAILDESGDKPVVSIANPDQPGLRVRVTLQGAKVPAGGVFTLGSGANLGRTVTAELESGTPGR